MTDQEILSKAANSFINNPKEIKIPIEPKNWIERLLIKKGYKKAFAVYPVRKILNGNRFRIASRAVKFPEDILKGKDLHKMIFESTIAINDDLIYIAAVAVQNDRNEPSKTLLDQLKWVDDSVFADILDKSLSMIDLPAFIRSIVLIQGTENLLIQKTSPQDTREIIARGDNSKAIDGISE